MVEILIIFKSYVTCVEFKLIYSCFRYINCISWNVFFNNRCKGDAQNLQSRFHAGHHYSIVFVHRLAHTFTWLTRIIGPTLEYYVGIPIYQELNSPLNSMYMDEPVSDWYMQILRTQSGIAENLWSVEEWNPCKLETWIQYALDQWGKITGGQEKTRDTWITEQTCYLHGRMIRKESLGDWWPQSNKD